MNFKAKNYKSRNEIDIAIITECGKDIEVNRKSDYLIEGTWQELSDLSLSTSVNIYGVKIKQTD